MIARNTLRINVMLARLLGSKKKQTQNPLTYVLSCVLCWEGKIIVPSGAIEATKVSKVTPHTLTHTC